MMMIPTARLRIEYAPMNPPKPTGVVVIDGGDQIIAVIELEELRRAFEALQKLEAPLSGESGQSDV